MHDLELDISSKRQRGKSLTSLALFEERAGYEKRKAPSPAAKGRDLSPRGITLYGEDTRGMQPRSGDRM